MEDDSAIELDDASSFEDDESVSEDSSSNDDNQDVAMDTKGMPSSRGSASGVLSLNKNAGNMEKPSAKNAKTVEETYQKKTMREHILLRPDTYIGSTERVTEPMFVLDIDGGRIVRREITYTPGLFKIFDEIIVNAADNKQRDSNMDKLDILIDPVSNTISVQNNGKGIPIVIHKEHKCYVPTLIFSQFLTGSNFDDNEKKTTGGRNGYGSKLTNVFSTQFTVECVDTEQGLKFKQVFRNNLTVKEEPIVKKCSASELKKGDWVKITFTPDLARFRMASLDRDTVALLSKRAYDIAGTMVSRLGKKLSVSLNGKKVAISSFKDYLKLFDGINTPAAFEKVGDRWEVGVAVSDGSAQQISFVNAISTSKGGKHVAYIVDQVAAHLAAVVKKKNKGGSEIKPNLIKNHLCVFVNCLIENPAFDSQTKENLITNRSDFGSTCKLPDKFLKQIEKSGVVEAVLSFAKFKQGQALKRNGGVKKAKLTGIAKLDDANFAGTAKSRDCTLIITEGDSAKSLAMSGLSIIGRDYFGVFPLRGKPLNVRDANLNLVLKNEEIKNLVDILGLKFNTKYDENNIKSLRYGHLMIMADQDHDGSHIKGLVINFIHHFWPSLLDVTGFVQQFITPIVKATRGKASKTFFTLPQYEAWKESTGNSGKGYNIKYYKGLGTSTSAEAKEYFSNLQLHRVLFDQISRDLVEPEVDDEMDIENELVPDKATSGSDLIDMAFRKDRAEDRKNWLTVHLKKDPFVDYTIARRNGLKYSEFINKEFILFSQSDCLRSIPHVMDGFKPSQRKVLYACFKRKLKGEIKVAQLAGYIGEHTAYHHGEASLHGAIIGMAQSFCGSNNVNLLTPSGQFGTRRMGGKDAASPRYIFTKLEAITRTIFHPDDDELLSYMNDDGMTIEPEYFMPVIPMVLVNGSDGIGTGWSSNIPNYDPRAVINNIRRLISSEPLVEMKPQYNGFSGEINLTLKGSFEVRGRIERLDDETLYISELPIKKWTQDYKQFLEEALTGSSVEGNEKVKEKLPKIKDFKENHTDTTVSFTITAEKSDLDKYEKEKGGLYAKFKLAGSISTSNMHLFDTGGVITKYPSPESILTVFYHQRLDFYGKRKDLLLHKLRREQKMLSNKARFIEEVCNGDLVVSNRKRAVILAELKERGYDLFDKESKAKTNESDDEEEEVGVDVDSNGENLAKGYEYLLGMKIWSLTFEKAEELRKQLADKTKIVADLEAMTPSQIWLNDLESIEEALYYRDEEMKTAATEEKKAQGKGQKNQAKITTKKAAPKGKGAKKKVEEWPSESEESSLDDEHFSDASPEPLKSKNQLIATKNIASHEPDAGSFEEFAMDTDSFAQIPDRSGVAGGGAKAALQSNPSSRNANQSQKTRPLKKAVLKKSKKDALSSDEELASGSESEMYESLMDRMKKKLAVSPPPKKANRTIKSTIVRGTKRPPSPLIERSQMDEFDSLGNEASSVLAVPTGKAANKQKVQAKPVTKKVKAAPGAAKKRTVTKGGRLAKAKQFDDLSSSDFDELESINEDSDTTQPTVEQAPTRARPGRARKEVKYILSDDDDESN